MIRGWTFVFCCGPVLLLAQSTSMSDRAAKDAVQRIVRHSGLQPDFTVLEDLSIPTAVAYIKDRQRIIAYNPVFIARIADSSATDRSAISILAHEIGHHLLGHTLDPDDVRPGDELACDRYSGFILAAMGVGLEESRAAMEVAGNPHGSERHPPKHARLAAIEQGWHEWQAIRSGTTPAPFTLKDDLQYVIAFHGDDHTYYVDAHGQVLWYDNYAAPIPFGAFSESRTKEFSHQLTWGSEVYHVDARLTIWKRTELGLPLQVGYIRAFQRP